MNIPKILGGLGIRATDSVVVVGNPDHAAVLPRFTVRTNACQITAADWVLVLDGLRHQTSPHSTLQDLCRVPTKGIVVIEARDSILSRAAVRLGVMSDYTTINRRIRHTYRWTPSELLGVMRHALPTHAIRLHSGLTRVGVTATIG